MASKFGWVDFAETDRQRMLDVVHLFREQDTRDELGIGVIRDGFADFFFPGTSTIQTRARYFLFIPWIYLSLENKPVPSAQIKAKARQCEVKLIYALLKSDDTDGVIGKEAKEDLQRLPSSVYWSGLGSWGLRVFPGSQDEYHRCLDRYYRHLGEAERNDDGEPVAGKRTENWHPGLPEAPENLLEKTTFSLSREETTYLVDRVTIRHPESLLARIFRERDPVDCAFPWKHPILAGLPTSMVLELTHARNFSELLYGAALLYNLMLAEERGIEDWIESYGERIGRWQLAIRERWADLSSWHEQLAAFWSCPALREAQVKPRTRSFVEDWFNLLFSKGPEGVASDRGGRRLIREREQQLKGPRARLGNARALELWNGAAGDRQIDYRWGNALVLQRDILKGLRTRAEHA